MAYPFDCITDFIFVETEIAPADVIVVPGSSHPQLMEKAAALYHQGLAPYVLPSGGSTKNVETTEWNFLRDIGVSLGVPEEVILKEDRAKNTFQNAEYSWEVLQKSSIYPKKVILASKAQHARRALLTYQTVFPKETEFYLAPVIDKSGITKDNWFLTGDGIKRVMIEVEKIGAYFAAHIPNWVIKNEYVGKYEKLYVFLTRQKKEDSLTLTFKEIEEILQFQLPKAAYVFPTWWANQNNGKHKHSRSWLFAHWKTTNVEAGSKVTFIKGI